MISKMNRYMYRRWSVIIREFRALWKNYLYQSLLAGVVILVVFWVLSAEQAVIIASIGSSAFIVFAMPSYPTARSRRVIGGHLVGVVCGSLAGLILEHFAESPIAIYSVAVAISTFLMVSLDFEHPPACGTALGVALNGFSFKVLIAVLTSAIILSLAHHYLKRYLRDLV